jgi:hypothetical protein
MSKLRDEAARHRVKAKEAVDGAQADAKAAQEHVGALLPC